MQSGLKINKKPAFAPIVEDFMINLKNILRRAEESLVQLLLTEFQKVIKNLDSDIEKELQNVGYEISFMTFGNEISDQVY